MSQIAGYLREKLNLTVHKIIFVKPVGEGKFLEVAQRYVSPTKTTFKLDKNHEYPFNAAQWTRQSKNRFIQYKDHEFLKQYDFYDSEHYQAPGGRVLQAVELAATKGAEVAKAVAQGGQLQAGVVLIILSVVVGLLGGVLLGYLGLPAGLGQHLVSNNAVVVK